MNDGELMVDFESLRISDGPVAPVAFDEPQLLDDTTISIDFEKDPLHRNCSQDDEVRLVAYCTEYKAFDFSNAFMRRSKRVVMQFNEARTGKEVHLWGFVVDRHGRASQSVYIGRGVLEAGENGNEDENNGIMLHSDDDCSQGVKNDVVTDGNTDNVEVSARVARVETPPGGIG